MCKKLVIALRVPTNERETKALLAHADTLSHAANFTLLPRYGINPKPTY